MNFNSPIKKFYGPEAGLGAGKAAFPWLQAAQAGIGAIQTVAGAIQRKRAEKAAQAQIGKLGPDTGILGYYNQALQRFGVSPTQSALYKRQMQNIRRSGAEALYGAGSARERMAMAPSIARSMSDSTLAAEVAGEQQQAQRFGQLGAAAQMAAAEKRRPEELRLQMQLQKAAGGTGIANVGMSNIFGALQSAATQKLYRDIYGVGGRTAKMVTEIPESLIGLSAENVIPGLLQKSTLKRQFLPPLPPLR